MAYHSLDIVSLFTNLSSQMVFPLIPFTVLGAGAYAVGIVEGAAETTFLYGFILVIISTFLFVFVKGKTKIAN